MSFLIIDKLWWLLNEHDLLPKKSLPKHLLWTLYFLTVYPRQSPGCSVVGASSSMINPKTFWKWVWMFIENIQELVDVVVSISLNSLVFFKCQRRWQTTLATVDGGQHRLLPLSPPSSAAAPSHALPPSTTPSSRLTSTGALKVTWATSASCPSTAPTSVCRRRDCRRRETPLHPTSRRESPRSDTSSA
jgi:hypothetical protein